MAIAGGTETGGQISAELLSRPGCLEEASASPHAVLPAPVGMPRGEDGRTEGGMWVLTRAGTGRELCPAQRLLAILGGLAEQKAEISTARLATGGRSLRNIYWERYYYVLNTKHPTGIISFNPHNNL